MAYTVTKLAKLSGVSIRTLHWYDEIGLLKPAFHGANGYRYYEEEQLLVLQQILFFRELGLELKQIQHILKQSDFDKRAALHAHRRVLEKNITRTKKLIKTIDTTIEHLKGTKKMKDTEMYLGFSKEKQNEYEEYMVNRFGEKAKATIEETKLKFKNLSKEEFDKSKSEWDGICTDLLNELNSESDPGSSAVQKIIKRHYEWLKGYWTPDRSSYIALGEQYTGFEWKQAFEPFDESHPQLAKFLAAGMKVFAEKKLS